MVSLILGSSSLENVSLAWDGLVYDQKIKKKKSINDKIDTTPIYYTWAPNDWS